MRFYILSDLHLRAEVEAYKTSDRIKRLCSKIRQAADIGENILFIILGDIVDKGKELSFTTARDSLSLIQEELKDYAVKFEFVPGNHDLEKGSLSLFDQLTSLYGSKHTFESASVYSVVHDNVNFIYADSTLSRDYAAPGRLDLDAIRINVKHVIEEFEIDNPMYGTLTRTLIEDQIPADDGSGLYPVEASRRIIHVLSAVMDMQFAVNSILRDMRFKVPVDLDKKYHFLQETGFVQVPKLLDQPLEYVFRSEVDYYKFLMLHFISANPNVALCECCGRYFIPKTAKKTLYCDRIIKDNKTCKNLAPGLKHKLQAQNKKVVEEFDRAKQKMYKRYERALDPDKKVTEKDLSYAEYYEWLDQATQARDAYLAGRLSEEDALKAIRKS